MYDNMNATKTSILIPVYNGMPYIVETINSVLAQTNKNWNLLISDNCSTDGTYEYLKTINDARINIVRQPANIGASKNWEFLYESCNTEYACILGADDILEPDFLEVLEHAITNNKEVGFVHSASHLIDENSNITGSYEQRLPYKSNRIEFLRNQLLYNQVNVTSCLFSIKKSKIRKVHFDSSKVMLFDWALWFDVHMKFDYSIYLDKKMCRYRQHSKSITSQGVKSPSWNLDQALLVLERIKNIPSENQPKYARYLANRILAKLFLRSIITMNWNKVYASVQGVLHHNTLYDLGSWVSFEVLAALKIFKLSDA